MSSSDFATADDLFGQPFKRRYTTCTLPVLDKVCRLRSLSEREFEEYQAGQLDRKGAISRDKFVAAQRQLLTMMLVDGAGNLLLSDSEKLKELDRADFEALCSTANALLGISGETIEDIVKNSDDGHGDS